MRRPSEVHRDILMRALREFARAEVDGEPITARVMAMNIGLAEKSGPGLRSDLVGLGWLRILKQGYGNIPTTVSVTDSGWTELGGRQCFAPKVKERSCMRCRRPFLSHGPGHRFCVECRKTNAFHEGADLGYRLALP